MNARKKRSINRKGTNRNKTKGEAWSASSGKKQNNKNSTEIPKTQGHKVSVSSTFLFGSAGIGLDGLDLDKDEIEEIDEIVDCEEEHAKKVAQEQQRIDSMHTPMDTRIKKNSRSMESTVSSNGSPNLRDMLFFNKPGQQPTDTVYSSGNMKDEDRGSDERLESMHPAVEKKEENTTNENIIDTYLKSMPPLSISESAMETFRTPLPECSFQPFAVKTGGV